jgi:pimeloyl-ACP methyl ester carboxylesterase
MRPGPLTELPIALLPVRRIRVGDFEIAESVQEAGGVQRGSPVLFLHGLGGFLENWVWNLPAAGAAGRRALAIDWPGFGRSDKPDASYSPRFLAGTMRRYLDLRRIDRAVLVGNSMGGLVAKVFAGMAPDRVAGLVLVDAAGAGPVYAAGVRILMAAAVARVHAGGYNRRFFRRLLPLVFHNRHPALIELLRLWGKSDVGGVKDPLLWRTLQRVVPHLAVTRTLPSARSLQMPVAVAWGLHDHIVPVTHGRALAAAIPGATLEVFANSGHVPMLEEPIAFNRWLIEQLARLP